MKLYMDDEELELEPVTPAPPVKNSRRPQALAEEPATPPAVVSAGPVAAAKRAAELTGDEVGVLPIDLNLVRAAMEEGVLVDVVVRFWRQTVKMQPADLGLSTEAELEAAKKQTSAGSVRLIPREVSSAFAAAETKIRRATRENGFRIDGHRGWFVPSKNWEAFQRLYNAGVVAFQDALDSFCAKLPGHVESMRAQLVKLAPRAWMGHRAAWDELGAVVPGQFTSTATPTAGFIEWFALQYVSKIPTAEIIKDYAEVRRTLNVLHVPDVAAAMNVAKSNVQLQDAVRDSLTEQRDSLPQRFIDSVARSVVEEIHGALVRTTTAGQKRPGASARAITALRGSIAAAREKNLTQDPRITLQLEILERGIRTVIARADGTGRPVVLDELLVPVKSCIDHLVEFCGAVEEGEE